MRTWLRTISGGLGLIAALAIGAAAPATAEANGVRAPAPSVFPVYPDPWRTNFRHRRHFGRHSAHDGRVFIAPHPVWVRAYWAWNGFTWVWVPGHWAY